jgi:hypothetical protein
MGYFLVDHNRFDYNRIGIGCFSQDETRQVCITIIPVSGFALLFFLLYMGV